VHVLVERPVVDPKVPAGHAVDDDDAAAQ